MIKGAVILATGYALGFAHAMSQMEDVKTFCKRMTDMWEENPSQNTTEGESS